MKELLLALAGQGLRLIPEGIGLGMLLCRPMEGSPPWLKLLGRPFTP